MTDNEIVKAWNEEIHLANYVDESYRNGISISLIENTLDLINRLQADKEALIAGQETLQAHISNQNKEISRLTLLAKLGEKRADDYRAMRDRALKAEAEIEKLKEASEEAVSCFHRMESLYNIKCMELKVAKAEAIKELMFNLHNEISTYSSAGKDLNVYAWLKNYAKEMVGDTE